MRTTVTRIALVSAMALVLTPGCSSMTKSWDKLTGKSTSADRTQGTVELNSAGQKRLAALPGLTVQDADRIIANRPYNKPHDLVAKGVLTQSQLDKIRAEVYVEHGKK